MTTRRYRALLVGNWQYGADTQNLPDLKGPLNDISRLAAALSDQEIGMFAWRDIRTLPERASHEILYAAESFFDDASEGEVLLFYYSGHCLTDESGAMLLCGNDSVVGKKRSTMVPIESIIRLVEDCRAVDVVIALDLKYSGQHLPQDFAAQAAGPRRLILVGTSDRELIREEQHEAGLSLFTSHLVRGLRGDAASPGASHVTFGNVCHYVQLRMQDQAVSTAFSAPSGQSGLHLARALAAPQATDAEAAYNPGPTGGASTLTVSETLIEIGEVEPDETLPVEVIYVSARTLAGYPAQWRARTAARWIGLGSFPDRLEITVRPSAIETRANIEVRNEETGATRTVRVSARLRQPRGSGVGQPQDSGDPSDAPEPDTAWRRLPFEDQQKLIDALLALSGMRDGDLRSFYVQELEAKIGRPLHLARHAEARHDVWSIVGACLDRPGTLRVLAGMLRVFHGDTGETREVARLVEAFDSEEPGELESGLGNHFERRLRLADEYFFVSHDGTGAVINNRAIVGAGLAGALVGELLLQGQLTVSRGRVRRESRHEHREPAYRAIDALLDAAQGQLDLLDVVTSLRKDSILWVSQRLTDDRLVSAEISHGFLRKRSIRYMPVNQVRASEPINRLMRYIIDSDASPDQQTALLAALMNVTGLQKLLVGDLPRQNVEERLQQLVESVPSSELNELALAVDQAIAAITYGPTRR